MPFNENRRKMDEKQFNFLDNSDKESRESVPNTFFYQSILYINAVDVHKIISAENMRQRFWIITARNNETFSNESANRQRIMLFELQISDGHLNNATFIFCVFFSVLDSVLARWSQN